MTDCPNAEVRDLLPDLLHGRLEGDARARVEAHLRTCADCREELDLLRSLRDAAPAPRVDVGRIVAALPAPRRRRVWNSHLWQAAAAVLFMAVGGTAVVHYVYRTHPADTARVAVASTNDSAVGTAVGGVELSVGYGYTDLTDAQLQTLLQDVEKMTAVPMADPDASLPNVTIGNGGV